VKFSRTIMLPIAGLAVLAALSGCGANNNPLGLNQVDTTPPPAPTNLEVRYVSGQPTLVWDASAAPDVVGYQVEVFSAGGADYVQASDPNGQDTSYQLPVASVQDTYRVRAVDASGNWSAFSSTVTPSGDGGGPEGSLRWE
jgi:hypothetical protein